MCHPPMAHRMIKRVNYSNTHVTAGRILAFEELKQDPSAHFSSPEQVLSEARLSQQDKIEVLTNWANEMRQLQVAEEENMSGAGGAGETLAKIEDALRQLGAEESGEHDAKA
jgi:hypothetical protein